MKSVLHQMMSPCENFIFYWRPIGRLLDWVESLPTHKGSDSSESPNGGGENILIESSTVLNSEKDFSKFDQIDRESHHLLGRPTDRPSWAGRPCHRTFLSSQESHYWSNRGGSNSLANEKSTVLTLRKKNPRKEEESLRQELGKQARRRKTQRRGKGLSISRKIVSRIW